MTEDDARALLDAIEQRQPLAALTAILIDIRNPKEKNTLNTVAKITSLIIAGLLVGCGAASTCGCEDGCAATASCTSTELPPCPDDPRDGDIRDDCGVWVSATLGDDDNPGTQAAPVRTLQRGVDMAPGGHVYACAETYMESVTLPAGTSLHGGWYCQQGWSLAPLTTRAAIAPEHGDIALRMVEGDGESLVTDLVAKSGDASGPGASSIAAWAEIGAIVELRRVELRAGDGAAGLPGSHGGATPAKAGASGIGGDDACSADMGLGGLVPVTQCDDGPSAGGIGGDGSELAASVGGDGLPDLGAGQGGLGEELAPTCTPGKDGADGIDGLDGVGGTGQGSLVAFGFVGVGGTRGIAGTRAQGGGGGGASFGGLGCGLLPHGGAGGGSGGAGGCGGKPGLGGGAGGASFALVSRSDGVRLVNVTLVSGDGGFGGLGGTGQFGGLGGLPGLGGASYNGPPPIHAACTGGFGGQGGRGGNGGGGSGGPSAAIAHSFGAAPVIEGVEMVVGIGGDGGLGGDATTGGADGVAVKVLEL